MYNKDILYYWIQKNPLSIQQKNLFNNANIYQETYDLNKNYHIQQQILLNKIPSYNSLSNFNITFANSQTDLINELFEKYVDDDTLIISSDFEHDSVVKCLNNYKNVILLNYFEDILKSNFSKLSNIKNYKKIFVYFISVGISNGLITPQSFFENLKKFLTQNNTNHIMILDDPHGMFLYPRNYQIFDYILNTAHALLTDKFNAGICLNKKENIGKKSSSIIEIYNQLINLVNNRKNKINQFKFIIQDYFYNYTLKYGLQYYNYPSVNHICSIICPNSYWFTQKNFNKLKKEFKIRLEGKDSPFPSIRFRACQHIFTQNTLIPGIQYLEKCFETYLE